MKKVLISVTIFCFLVISCVRMSAAEIKLGINAHRGALNVMKQWSEFGKYLSSEFGQTVKIVPLGLPDVLSAAQNGTVDFLFCQPLQTVAIQEKYGVIPLVTLNTKSGSQFAGVIVARKGSGITKGTDLKGKKVISMKHKIAAGAYLFQAYHLYKQGIDVHQDFATFMEGKNQDDLVLAVKAGLFDAAFIRTGILETMSKNGKISLDDFIIVDQRTDPEIQLLHTTVLYPEWFISATSKTDPNISTQLKEAVLKITPETEAAKAANIHGFIEPISLEGMREAMKALKISPFDK